MYLQNIRIVYQHKYIIFTNMLHYCQFCALPTPYSSKTEAFLKSPVFLLFILPNFKVQAIKVCVGECSFSL